MQTYPEAEQIKQILNNAHALLLCRPTIRWRQYRQRAALEQILGDMGKEPFLLCGVEIPQYLSYLRVGIVSAKICQVNSTLPLLSTPALKRCSKNLAKTNQRNLVVTKPVIVLDHHAVDATIPYAKVSCNKTAVATGEVIYELTQQLDWPLNRNSKKK